MMVQNVVVAAGDPGLPVTVRLVGAWRRSRTGRGQRPEFVGRDPELAALVDALDRAVADEFAGFSWEVSPGPGRAGSWPS